MIEIRSLRKEYADFVAVRDLNLSVKKGEIFAFLGVNGAGKTTTLRMLTGVLRPTAGQISICGFDLAKEPEKAKAVMGFIPDRPYLYSKLTAREYLYFVADLHSLPESAVEQRLDELLQHWGLLSWQDELIEGFSHGMKQRLAMCAALVHSPQVLIVDEPMVGLDPHGAKLLKDSFKQYAAEGTSILLSTHSLNVAEELASRLAIINRGELIAQGDLQEVRALVESPGKQGLRGLEDIFLELTWTGEGTYRG